ncbi:Uncharacterised protein [Vibrio cholerae]|nr:Uncharacterised protein [Vibrio cholerae]
MNASLKQGIEKPWLTHFFSPWVHTNFFINK